MVYNFITCIQTMKNACCAIICHRNVENYKKAIIIKGGPPV